MKKRIIEQKQTVPHDAEPSWWDIEEAALVELQSETPDHPIEAALIPGRDEGWIAGESGPQTLRLLFHEPRTIRRILLLFGETTAVRTQEFVLRWSADGGKTYHDLVRQQWNFSPSGSSCETEDYHVNLLDVTTLELHIIPDISGGPVQASLKQWRIA